MLHWEDLGIAPIALDLGLVQIRWYALSYLAMLLLGWWYMRRLVRVPGAPIDAAEVDDLLTYVTIGVVAGGRLGYALFYDRALLARPLSLLAVWHGGMAFHGGLIGVIVATALFARRRRVSLVRVLDYLACAAPFGLILVRLANFANGELWGRPTDLPWGMTFPGAGDRLPRHPSQLYEAAIEGGVLMIVLLWAFWRTDWRLRPGRLAGIGLLHYGCARFLLEYVRQPDRGLEHLGWGLTMGQTLSVPIIAAGVALLLLPARPAPPCCERDANSLATGSH